MGVDIGQYWAEAVAIVGRDLVGPALGALGLTNAFGNTAEVAEAVLITALQLAVILLVFRPLEGLMPAERWTDRRLTTIDRHYTLLMLLGLFPLFSYLVLTPVAHLLSGEAGGDQAAGGPAWGLTQWVPWFDHHPYAAFAVYYVVYDLAYYWMHRAQHAIPWWWALHSMHHSQRQMSCWSNDRTAYLDGVLQSFVLAGVALVMGVDPAQFAWLVLLSELVQNFSHANVRLRVGARLGQVFVGPAFHRLHHMVRDPDRPTFHNCNFGQVLSVWDRLFGTARYGEPVRPTGVSDPVVDADNGKGLIALQWYVLKRFWAAFRRPAGWRLGDVHFGGPGYAPIADEADAGTPVPVRPPAAAPSGDAIAPGGAIRSGNPARPN
jgi:sterol desaturase/sphingolipid hydroxylase (fatty acid hydroxylase superfamily)